MDPIQFESNANFVEVIGVFLFGIYAFYVSLRSFRKRKREGEKIVWYHYPALTGSIILVLTGILVLMHILASLPPFNGRILISVITLAIVYVILVTVFIFMTIRGLRMRKRR